MESRPALLLPPGNDACWESKPKPTDQHRKGNISPGARTRLHVVEAEAKEQEERCSSRESAGHVKTLKHTALAVPVAEPLPASTAASRIPTMHSATTKQVTAGTVNTTGTTKITSKQPAKTTVPGVEVLSLSSQTGSSGPKLRSPNTNHEKKLQANAKTFPKNMQKTASASHIMGSAGSPHKTLYKTASTSQISSTDSPKSLNRTSLSHIPRATSSPKLKLSHPASLKVDKTERNRRVTGKETLLSTSPKDKVIDTLVENKLELGATAAMGESPRGLQEIKSRSEREGETTEREISSLSSHPAKKPSTEQLKEPEDRTDAYVTTQERQTGKSQRLWEQKGREEAESEETRKTRARTREAEIKNDKMEVLEDTVMSGKNKTPTSKNLKDAVTTTGDIFTMIEMKDAALQVDLCPVYIDAEVQAVVELCSRSTDMSPVRNAQHDQMNSEVDLNPEVGLNSDLNPDSNSDSDWLPCKALRDPSKIGAKPRFLGPPPYKSPNTQKPFHHMCQIEIELRSQSPLTLSSDPPQVIVSEFDTTCQVSHEVGEKTLESSFKSLDSGKTQVGRENEESGAPQEIVWDEQGMTWEVYGASLDMESLGFAIQNHLECKIREHERRIGTLRKSICLSEQSPGKGRTGQRKRNVFRSFFAGSNCCSKPRPKEELAK